MLARRLLPLLTALLLTACGDSRLPQLQLGGSALGTSFNVSIVEPPGALDEEALQANILATLARIDLLGICRDSFGMSARGSIEARRSEQNDGANG